MTLKIKKGYFMTKTLYLILIIAVSTTFLGCQNINSIDSITDMQYLKENEDAMLYRIKILRSDGTTTGDICLFDKNGTGIFNDIQNIIKCEVLEYENGKEIKPIYTIIKNPKYNLIGDRDWEVCEYVITIHETCITISEYILLINPFRPLVKGHVRVYDSNIKQGTAHDGSMPYDFTKYLIFTVLNFDNSSTSLELIEYFLEYASNNIRFNNITWFFDRFFDTKYTSYGYITVRENEYEGGRFYYLSEKNTGFESVRFYYESP